MIRWQRATTDGQAWFISYAGKGEIFLHPYRKPGRGWYLIAPRFGLSTHTLTLGARSVKWAKIEALRTIREHVENLADIVDLYEWNGRALT